MQPHLSIVIPSYNEEDRLPPTLERIDTYVREQRIDAEILVVDDGSSDETARLAGEFLEHRNGRVIRLDENRGKGAAVRRGVQEARGRWVLMTDADLSSPIEEHAKLATMARDSDVDIVIASRGLHNSQVEVRQAWVRKTMGRTFNVLMRGMTGLPFKDTQCGFKLLDGNAARALFAELKIDGFAYDVEMTWLALRYGYSIKEVGVRWQHVEESRVHLLLDPMKMFMDVCRVRFYHRGSVVRAGGLPQVDESEADPLGRASRF